MKTALHLRSDGQGFFGVGESQASLRERRRVVFDRLAELNALPELEPFEERMAELDELMRPLENLRRDYQQTLRARENPELKKRLINERKAIRREISSIEKALEEEQILIGAEAFQKEKQAELMLAQKKLQSNTQALDELNESQGNEEIEKALAVLEAELKVYQDEYTVLRQERQALLRERKELEDLAVEKARKGLVLNEMERLSLSS
jgi:hypothetical protein